MPPVQTGGKRCFSPHLNLSPRKEATHSGKECRPLAGAFQRSAPTGTTGLHPWLVECRPFGAQTIRLCRMPIARRLRHASSWAGQGGGGNDVPAGNKNRVPGGVGTFSDREGVDVPAVPARSEPAKIGSGHQFLIDRRPDFRDPILDCDDRRMNRGPLSSRAAGDHGITPVAKRSVAPAGLFEASA